MIAINFPLESHHDLVMICVFVIESDAYLKGALNIADSLSQDIGCNIFSTKKILVREGVVFFDIEDAELCNIVFNSDLLFLGMGGKNLNKFIKKARDTNSRSKIVGYFPGILHLNIFESLITRLLCDVVLLNSKHDFDIYKSISEKLLGYNNGILFGAPWVSPKKYVYNRCEIDLLFVEQSIVPDRLYLRKKMLIKLCKLAFKNKEKKIVIAIRAKNGEESSHKVLYPLDQFNISDMPTNLSFSYSDINELISISDRVATISSSAAYISITQGKFTYFISDLGVRRRYGNDFFKKSGMFCRINRVFNKNPRVTKWKELNVQGMDVNFLNDILRVKKSSFNSIPCVNIFSLTNIFYWIKLCIRENQEILSLFKLYKTVSNINLKIYRF